MASNFDYKVLENKTATSSLPWGSYAPPPPHPAAMWPTPPLHPPPPPIVQPQQPIHSKRLHPCSDSDDDAFSEESSKDPLASPTAGTGGDSCQLMTRKRRRGVIEKRRRDRINRSLSELRRLVPSANEKQASAKLEKAEILQLTVDHLKTLHTKGSDALSYEAHKQAMDYHNLGFRECAAEVARYLVTVEGMDIQDPLRLRLMSHLQCFAAQRDISKAPPPGTTSTPVGPPPPSSTTSPSLSATSAPYVTSSTHCAAPPPPPHHHHMAPTWPSGAYHPPAPPAPPPPPPHHQDYNTSPAYLATGYGNHHHSGSHSAAAAAAAAAAASAAAAKPYRPWGAELAY